MATNDSILRTILLVVALLLLVPFLMMLLAWPMMGMWSGGHMWGGTGGGWWWLLLWLVPLVVILGVGYLLYRAVAGSGGEAGTDAALEELRLAYARGDLSSEEFEDRRERLRREE